MSETPSETPYDGSNWMNLSRNFTKAEMECKCGCGFVPSADFMGALQDLRDRWGKSMKITSAARCPKHNATVGGVADSKHMKGIAVDVALDSVDRWAFVKLAMEQGWQGIGIAASFIHIDRRPPVESRIWHYSDK